MGQITEDGSATLCEMYERGFSCKAIAHMVGLNHATQVHRVLKKAGVATRPTNGHAFHKQYRGGRIWVGEYWRVKVSLDDPMASMRNNLGYVLEHRLVMARKLGRPLKESETVHHIDGDKENNSPDNL